MHSMSAFAWMSRHSQLNAGVFILELEMTGRKLYTVWCRDDFYIQIGIDWDFPSIKDRIMSIAGSYLIFPYDTDTTFETGLADFLTITAKKLSSSRRISISLEDNLIEICKKYKLQLDGKDGITLCKFEIPNTEWPMYPNFLITNIEKCNDLFHLDDRLEENLYNFAPQI
jgi:hypothetical protein